MKLASAILGALALICLAAPAEARHRATAGWDPGCNVLFPCEAKTEPYLWWKSWLPAAKPRVHRHRRVAARRHHHHPVEVAKVVERPPAAAAVPVPAPRPEATGNGIVKASTGAVAYVARHATVAFQCMVDKLEAAGYRIKEMGGFANRGHIRHSLHYSGLALDVNQLARNVTSPRMPSNEIELATSCGLISGAQWRGSPDSGHFQYGGWSGQPKRQRYAHARRHYRVRYARRLE